MGTLLSPLLILLHLRLGRAQPAEVITSGHNLTANFDYKSRPFLLDYTTKSRSPWLKLPVPELSLSTVQLCQAPQECTPCIRLKITMNATGFPRLRGFQVSLLELKSNNFSEFEILKRNRATVQEMWTVQYDCFMADEGSTVSVWLGTIPDYNITVLQEYVIQAQDSGPPFSHTFDEMDREINITVSPGPNLNARLCHKRFICEELHNSFQVINTSLSLSAILPYDFLVPCLCIEVFYLYHDSRRTQICPFTENPKAFGTDMWNSAKFEDHSKKNSDQMKMEFTPLCYEKPSVSLCHKPTEVISSNCEDFPNSTASEIETDRGWIFSIDKVDRNPRLCFKFSLGNNTHVECPKTKDTRWNVTTNVHLLHLVLTFNFNHHVAASFSATKCRKSEDGQCLLSQLVHTIAWTGGSSREKVELILPFQFQESCVLVWRSDVRFAVKELICPDFSRMNIGLVAVGLLVGLLLAIAVLFLSCRRILDTKRAPLRRRTVLLVYSLDSEQYKIAICAFADFLRTSLACDVILDLWDVSHVTQMGVLPWLYSKKELVEKEKGKVIVLWTQYSSKVYEMWKSTNAGSGYQADPHNLFGAAMSLLQSDIQKLSGKERLQDYILVYFDGLCAKQDIPVSLRRIPQYRLFKDLQGMVNTLQHTAQGPPFWIRAATKFLIRKLLKSDKSANVQQRLDQCRLHQPDDYGWQKGTPETKMETYIF